MVVIHSNIISGPLTSYCYIKEDISAEMRQSSRPHVLAFLRFIPFLVQNLSSSNKILKN